MARLTGAPAIDRHLCDARAPRAAPHQLTQFSRKIAGQARLRNEEIAAGCHRARLISREGARAERDDRHVGRGLIVTEPGDKAEPIQRAARMQAGDDSVDPRHDVAGLVRVVGRPHFVAGDSRNSA